MKKVVYLSLFLFFAVATAAGFITLNLNNHTAFAYEAEAITPRAYLPLLIGNPAHNTPPTATPPPPTQTPPQIYQGALFADMQLRTSSAGIVIDKQGGMHFVHTYYEAGFNDPPTFGVYYYCPSSCDKDASWHGVGLGEDVNEMQLALTSNGRPRILFRTHPAENNGDIHNEFYYAACDSNCTETGQWTVTYLASNHGTTFFDLPDDAKPQRYFALDPQNRPRFIYNDFSGGHYGTFYAYCDSGCTNANNWFETRINKDNTAQGGPYRDENFYYPALTFTADSQPRVLVEGTSMQDESGLFYLSCDSGCGHIDNWTNILIAERGQGNHVSYDIEINAQGQPRVAYYQGALLGGQGDHLFYIWCNNNCTNVASWEGTHLGLGQNDGRGPDLELDANGRPHIAYALYQAGGLGYSWCNNGCQSAGGNWQHKVVESRADLMAAWTIAYPPHCNEGLWDGVAPTLSLDKDGNPRIAYDTEYYARCIYTPETGEWKPWHEIHLVWRAARVVFFPQS